MKTCFAVLAASLSYSAAAGTLGGPLTLDHLLKWLGDNLGAP
jgi:hypothetical protein